MAWLVVLGMITVMLFMLNSGNLQRNVQEIDQAEFYVCVSNRTIKTCEIIRESVSQVIEGLRVQYGGRL